MIRRFPTPRGQIILLQPDCIPAWRGNCRLMAAAAGTLLLMAVGSVALGAWPVLPFLILALLALCTSLYHACCKSATRQVLRIGRRALILEQGIPSARRRWRLKLSETTLQRRRRNGPLTLCQGGRRIPLGMALSVTEATQLAVLLGRCGLRITPPGKRPQAAPW